jgi:hypothetical protein
LQNIINWSANPDSSSIASFNVYRAICGTTSAVGPFTVTGMYLKLQTDAADFPRIIKLSSNAVIDIISQLNLIPGIFCKLESPNKFSIRSSGKFLKIFSTEGATALGITAGTYVPQDTFSLVSNVPFISGTGAYQFIDSSGYRNDWYYITTLQNITSVESLPGQQLKSVDNYLNVCCLEGLIVSFNGAEPVKGARITAKLFSAMQPKEVSSFSIGNDIAEAYTDEYGRWRLTVPRCATIYIEIPATNYSNVFEVPNLSAFYFSQIIADNDWRFSNDSRPVTGGDFI